MKKKIVILLTCVLLALGLVACGEVKSYSYTNPPVSDRDWRDLVGDADMTVDGALDEANWQNKNALTFTTGYNDDVNIAVTAHLGERGVYIAVTVTDDYLFYNTQRTVYNNTSVELHISQVDAQALDKNVIQLRYGLNGYTEQWIGVASSDGYAYSRIYVPNMARIRLTGENAEINNRVEGQGFVLETFVPYTSFGLDAKPEKVKIGPAYNHVRDANTGNSERLHKDAPGMSYTDPISFATFDANGYSKADSEALATEKTIDGDLSDWTAADVLKNKIKIVDKEENGKQVEFYAYLGADGLYIASDAVHGTYVDNHKDWFSNTNLELFINGNNNDTNHRWVTPDKASNTNMRGGLAQMKTVDNGEAAGAARYHTTAELFLPFRAIPGYKAGDKYVRVGFAFKTPNDELYKGHAEFPAGGGGHNSGASDDWWFAVGHTPNNPAEHYYVKPLGILETPIAVDPQLDIDADLSDWTNATVNAHKSVVKDAESDKGFTVRAFLQEEGLYVAYEAKHALYKTTENDWFNNTNAEIQLFGGHQVFVSAKNATGDTQGDRNLPAGAQSCMKTTDSGDAGSATRYTTVVEIFIPVFALENYGYNAEVGYARAGFAFKTQGDQIASGSDNSSGVNGKSDWWWAKDHSIGHMAEQYYITEDGILDTVDGLAAITLDGNRADWEALANWSQIEASKLTLYDTDATRIDEHGKCGYTVYSFADKHGLYAYYEVRHHVNPVDGGKAWHENPNAEIFIGAGDGTQCFASAKPESKNMLVSFKTTEVAATDDDKAHFVTTVELFIPYYVYRGLDEGTVRVRFGFKTNNGSGTFDDITVPDASLWNPGNTTDSWWMNNPVNVGANGIVK